MLEIQNEKVSVACDLLALQQNTEEKKIMCILQHNHL